MLSILCLRFYISTYIYTYVHIHAHTFQSINLKQKIRVPCLIFYSIVSYASNPEGFPNQSGSVDEIKQAQLVTNLSVSLDAAVRRDRLYVQVSQQGLFSISVPSNVVFVPLIRFRSVISCLVFFYPCVFAQFAHFLLVFFTPKPSFYKFRTVERQTRQENGTAEMVLISRYFDNRKGKDNNSKSIRNSIISQ